VYIEVVPHAMTGSMPTIDMSIDNVRFFFQKSPIIYGKNMT